MSQYKLIVLALYDDVDDLQPATEPNQNYLIFDLVTIYVQHLNQMENYLDSLKMGIGAKSKQKLFDIKTNIIWFIFLCRIDRKDNIAMFVCLLTLFLALYQQKSHFG